MPRYLLMIANDEGKDAGEGVAAEYVGLIKELRERGVLLGSERLRPSSEATTVRMRNGEVLTKEGPFVETKEQLAGYLVVAADSLELAVQLASKVPDARDGAVEVREIWEM